jgi:hypothetical protein
MQYLSAGKALLTPKLFTEKCKTVILGRCKILKNGNFQILFKKSGENFG